MRDFYFTYENGKRVLYEQIGNNKKINVFQDLRNNELLLDISTDSIIDLKEENNYLQVTYSHNIKITYDVRVFQSLNDSYQNYMNIIHANIKHYNESKQLERYKKLGVIPTINRNKSKNNPKMFIVATLGSALILLSTTASQVLPTKAPKEAKKVYLSSDITESPVPTLDDLLKLQKKDDEEEVKAEPLALVEEVVEKPVTNVISLDYEYKDKTKDVNYKGETVSEVLSKYYGEDIEYYAKRWGLSDTLALAQVCQESPAPDQNGNIKNPYQLTYKYFTNRTFKVPVYDENGFTGTYDEFTTPSDPAQLATCPLNIMTALAQLRESIDYSDSIITGLYLYNHGKEILYYACEHYGVDFESVKGDENCQLACQLVADYCLEKYGSNYGDKNYIENILGFLPANESGQSIIEGYVGSEKVTIAINNVLTYNNNQTR